MAGWLVRNGRLGVSSLLVAGLASAGALGLPSAPASAAPAPVWSQMTDVTVGSTTYPEFRAISCTGAGECTAVGQENSDSAGSRGPAAVYATEVEGLWGTTTELSGPGTSPGQTLSGVSCTGPGDCQAVGMDGNGLPDFVTETGGSWDSHPTEFTFASGITGGQFAGVSCASAGYCTAVGYDTNSGATPIVSTEINGAWTEVSELSGVGGLGTALSGVSCYSGGNCTAIGFNSPSVGSAEPVYAVESGGTWSALTALTASGLVQMSGISCPSSGNCTAVGTSSDPTAGTNNGVEVTETGGTWGAVETFADPAGSAKAFLRGVSCTAVGTCTAVGDYETGSGSSTDTTPDYVSEAGGVWGSATAVAVPANDTLAYLEGVSCYGPGVCTAAAWDQGNNSGGVASSTPTVSGLAFTGGPAAPTLTLTGSGFGSSAAALGSGSTPCGPSSTGLDYIGQTLKLFDLTQGWTAGVVSESSCSYVGLRVLSYSDTKVVIGLGSTYPTYGTLASGDLVALYLLGGAVVTNVAYGPTVNPAHVVLQAGQAVTATLSGTLLVSGATVEVTGPSGLVTVSGVSVSQAGSGLTATFAAPVDATPGSYSLTVTDPNHTTTTCANCLTVTAPPAVCTQKLPAGTVIGMADTASGNGYWIASSTGLVAACGDAPNFGNGPSGVAAIAAAPHGDGYWLATTGGQVYAYGSAVNQGGLKSGTQLNKPIVAMAADPATGGYWLLGGDGGVFSFNAPFYGSTGNIKLNQPAVGLQANPQGTGYWFVASDGGIFTFGNATFYGSTGNIKLNKPVVGMAINPATGGYWMDASDGGIFSFNAPFYGSTGNITLAQPCVGMTTLPDGSGYRFVAADGGIFSFNAPFEGSAA